MFESHVRTSGRIENTRSRDGNFCRRLLSGAARIAFRNAVILGTPPPLTPVVFAANHPTTLDPLLLHLVAKRELSILVATNVFQVPIVGRVLSAAGNIPVLRGTGQVSIAAAGEAIGRGISIGIFPEGQLTPEAGISPARTGAVRISAETGVPIIPVGIWHDSSSILTILSDVGGSKETGRFNLSGFCVVEIGRPLMFDIKPQHREDVREASAFLRSEIGRLAARCESLGTRMKRAGFRRQQASSLFGLSSGEFADGREAPY
jgi:1-acyl-sn-glycerol-3-phosphate acyltransferase